MVASAGFAQIDTSGRVRAYFGTTANVAADESEEATVGFDGNAIISFGYEQPAFGDWTARAGFDTLLSSTETKRDGDICLSLNNGSYGVRFGHIKFLDSVASMGGWETSGVTLSESLVDQGQLSDRGHSVGFSVNAIDNLAIKYGIETSARTTVSAPDAAANDITETYNYSTAAFGLSAKYTLDGLIVGASIYNKVDKETITPKVEAVTADPTTTPPVVAVVGVDEVTEETKNIRIALGASYDLSSMQVPVNVWLGYYQNGTEVDEVKSGFSTIAVGGKYSFTGGNAGLSLEISPFVKETYETAAVPASGTGAAAVAAKDAETVDYFKAASSQTMVAWVNYNLSDNTKVFGTFGSYVKKQALKEDGDEASDVTSSSIRIGLRQNF
ncbi:MAG: hypothetical protein JJV97_02625 [SAR324 cluster bacterium]|nr:hypothetical protein [SAR324 cluster bacterium]